MSSTASATLETITCASCGTSLSADAEQCPECGRLLHPAKARITLAIVIFLILAGFALTQSIVLGHRDKEQALARNWFQRGERAMQAGYPSVATEDYRTAIYYDRLQDNYRLRLAESLLEQAPANDPRSPFITEARSHLIALWDQQPANGEVNLDLARLYAKEGEQEQAERFYRNAINGVWKDDPLQQRIATRFELIHYMLAHHQNQQAEAELIALQADSPPDVANRIQLANLLLQVNEPTRALSVYEAVLHTDPDNLDALSGAGRASLQVGDYQEAEQFLSSASQHEGPNAPVHQWYELARQVARTAPGLRGLSVSERAARTAAAYRAANDRLTACATKNGFSFPAPSSEEKAGQPAMPANVHAPAPTIAPPALMNLYNRSQQLKPQATDAALRQNPDAIEPTMDFVFNVERTTQAICPVTTSLDQALLLLAEHEGENEQ